MRRALLLAATAAVLLAVGVAFARAWEYQRKGVVAQAWEYRVVVLTDVVNVQQALQQEAGKTGNAVEKKFNELGADGWEYCGDLPGAAVFKRPKP